MNLLSPKIKQNQKLNNTAKLFLCLSILKGFNIHDEENDEKIRLLFGIFVIR